MDRFVPDFLYDADNVYRTKKYIVKQRVSLQRSESEDNVLISYDTYYLRNPKRDLAYNIFNSRKKKSEGRRIPTMLYSRRYVN